MAAIGRGGFMTVALRAGAALGAALTSIADREHLPGPMATGHERKA